MGLQHLGTPLSWDEARQYADQVKERGITQFLHIWDRVKNRYGDEFLWGDEIEYMVVVFDDETKNAKLSLCQSEVLAKLSRSISEFRNDAPEHLSIPIYHTEYARYMLESTPGSPYTGSIQDLLSVEANMHYRRRFVKKHLSANEAPVTITSFPRLGAPGIFTDPYFSPDNSKLNHSLFLPEEVIGQAARYPALTANTTRRRGCKLAINVPIFVDERTSRPFVDPTVPWQRCLYPEDAEAKNGAAFLDHIYMDASCFGGGCCCLQLTFQSCNIEEARRIYDALIPVAPIMHALAAASPIWRGYLSDVDCRWDVLGESIDDRTMEERGLAPLKESKHILPKSRCSTVDLYISTDWNNKPAYNDIYVPYNQEIYIRLVEHGVDELLSKHVAHLFIRDPLVILQESLINDENGGNHFESIQSTVWQTLRFKPPPPKSSIGWRVEFRSMDVQMTDFENAAFVIFIVLLSRAILAFNLNLYMPISKVDENMSRAQKRDAVRQGRFFFRKNVLPPGHVSPVMTNSNSGSPIEGEHSIPQKERKMRNGYSRTPPPATFVNAPVETEYEEMTMQEIFNGKGTTFPGLLRLVEAYLDTLDLDPSEREQVGKYIDLIRRRSNGSLLTAASWMRNFVRSHPSYKFDSMVTQEINYDLMVAIDEIERGVVRAPEFLPEDYTLSRVDGLHESKYEA